MTKSEILAQFGDISYNAVKALFLAKKFGTHDIIVAEVKAWYSPEAADVLVALAIETILADGMIKAEAFDISVLPGLTSCYIVFNYVAEWERL